MKQAGRPIGKRIRQLLDLLDEHGPMKANEFGALMGVGTANGTKYAHRAVEHGLAVLDDGKYSSATGWQEQVDHRPEKAHHSPPRFHALQTVWTRQPIGEMR